MFALDMNVALRERNLNAVSVQRVVDTFHHITYRINLFHGIHPAQQFEVDAAVAKLCEHHAYVFAIVYIAMAQCLEAKDSILIVHPSSAMRFL